MKKYTTPIAYMAALNSEDIMSASGLSFMNTTADFDAVENTVDLGSGFWSAS